MRHIRFVFVIALLAGIAGMQTTARMQGTAQIGSAPITMAAVSVRDIDAAIRNYVEIMGVQAPQVRSFALDLPNGSKTDLKTALIQLPNFQIELNQPVGKTGPVAEHLQKHGPGINRVMFAVSGSIDDMRSGLEAKGGKWVGGAKGGRYAIVDFRNQIGTMVEVVQQGAQPTAQSSSAATGSVVGLPPLGSLQVTHLGFAITDADKVAKAFTDILGIPMPRIRDYKDSFPTDPRVQYPPESPWNKDTPLRLTSWRQGPVGIELIASVGGPTPWSDFVAKQHGSAAQHIAINVGDKMDEMILTLQQKGGKWTNGKTGGIYAYLDFQDKLGLVFELNGTSKSAPPGSR